jgi:hypothetical protein
MSEITDCQTSSQSMTIHDLPYDILVRIFENLDFKSLNALALVDKKFCTFANDNYLWKKKLLNDIQKWRMIDSKTFPVELFEPLTNQINNNTDLSFKKIYLTCCPEILTQKDILKKLETFQQLHLTSTSEKLNLGGCMGNPNFTLSSLSSLAIFGQLKDFVYKNIFNMPQNENSHVMSREFTLNKIIMFGPGLG